MSVNLEEQQASWGRARARGSRVGDTAANEIGVPNFGTLQGASDEEVCLLLCAQSCSGEDG